MAAGNSLQAESATLEGTVLLDGFGSVFGATWEKTATAPQQGADHIFIAADQDEEQSFHGSAHR